MSSSKDLEQYVGKGISRCLDWDQSIDTQIYEKVYPIMIIAIESYKTTVTIIYLDLRGSIEQVTVLKSQFPERYEFF